MKLTESRLKEIIQEELESILSEEVPPGIPDVDVIKRLITLRKALSGDKKAKLERALDMVANAYLKPTGKPSIKTIPDKRLPEPEEREERKIMNALMGLKPTKVKPRDVAPVTPPRRMSPPKE